MGKASFWDRLAKGYDDEIGQDTVAITRKYLRSDDRVLDFGCARGAYTAAFAPNVKEIRGIDISPKMIELARASNHGLRFDVGGIEDVQDTFDVVLALNVLHLVDDLERTLLRIDEILKPGGRFVSVTSCMKTNLLLRVAGLVARLSGAFSGPGFTPSELKATIAIRFDIAETVHFEKHHVLIAATKRGGGA